MARVTYLGPTLPIRYFLGSGRGAMGRAWVFQTRGPAFSSRWCQDDFKCSCATLVYKAVDP